MKNATLLILGVIILGSASAAVTTALLSRPVSLETRRETTPASSSSTQAGDGEALARIEERLVDLTRTNRIMSDRIAKLEARSSDSSDAAAADDGFVSKREFEEFREKALGVAPEDVLALQEPEVFNEKVASALQGIRQQERVAKIEQYQEDRVERLDRDVERLGDWLELEPYQRDEMRLALEAQYAREAEQLRLWQEEGDDELAGQRKRDDAQVFRADLQRFLHPEQLTTFSEKFREVREER